MHPTVRLIAFDGDASDAEALERHRLQMVRANRRGNVSVALSMTAVAGLLTVWMARTVTEEDASARTTRTLMYVIGGLLLALALLGCCLFGRRAPLSECERRHEAND